MLVLFIDNGTVHSLIVLLILWRPLLSPFLSGDHGLTTLWEIDRRELKNVSNAVNLYKVPPPKTGPEQQEMFRNVQHLEHNKGIQKKKAHLNNSFPMMYIVMDINGQMMPLPNAQKSLNSCF
jgi:hypothetical protein